MKRILHLIGVVSIAGAAMPGWAGESAVLRSGLRLHAERHEVEGGKVRLFLEGGMVELPVSAITAFEADEAVGEVPTTQVQATEVRAAEVRSIEVRADAGLAKEASPAELASQAARKYALPESFVQSVMRAESGFHPAALSPKGAIGLMQLMPETARTLGVDPYVPSQNAKGGAQYLRDLLLKYEDNADQVLLALAAYNAGPGAVEKYHGVPPYRETREYILRVLKNWDRRTSPGH